MLRIPPIKAYLLFELQPAKRIPRIPTDESAIEKRIPSLRSASANPCPRGITAHPRREKVRVTIGARNRSTRFA